MIRCALSPARSRTGGVVAASICARSLRQTKEGARWAPSRSGPSRRRRRRRRRGGGGRLVVELLLRPEERVEHLVAQALAEAQRQAGTDDADQQELAEPAAALAALRPLAQRVARALQRVRRVLQLALELLVVEQLGRRLAVVDTAVRDPCGVVGRLHV